MTRLIDAEKLLQGYNDHDFIDTHVVWNAPTVDAVPVIRCKDCRHWRRNPINESSECGLCFKHKDVALATDRTDWCSWAERKDDGTI